MKTEFIPYESALALKELGFDEVCLAMYTIAGLDLFSQRGYAIPKGGYTNTELSQDSVIAAPLYQQAFRWFREKHQLYQAVYADKRADDLTLLYKVHVYKLDEELSEYAYRWAKTYEEAEQACLNKLIEIVKDGNKD